MSYIPGALLSSSSSVRTPAMPLPTRTSFCRGFTRMSMVIAPSGGFAWNGLLRDPIGSSCGHPFLLAEPAREPRRDRFHLALLLVEKGQDFLPAMVVGLVLGQRDAVARARERHVHDLAGGGRRAVGHHHHAV